jgi:predicted O-methyltransferase YrrM
MTNPAYSDPELLKWTIELSKKFNIDTFFETGSYHGGTAKIAAPHFLNVITVENNQQNYNIASENLKDVKNCVLIMGNSPEVMESTKLKNETFFFLDAHWEDYWPLLDELAEIERQGIKPVIAIHDFFVPDENGYPKFGYDLYKGQPLNFSYIEEAVDKLYGKNNYDYKYSTSSVTNSGVIYITPRA